VYAAIIPDPGRKIMAYEKLKAAYEENKVAGNCVYISILTTDQITLVGIGRDLLAVFPLKNSRTPAINWHTPPKNMSTPIRILGVVMERALRSRTAIRKMPIHGVSVLSGQCNIGYIPVAKDSSPRGKGLAIARPLDGSPSAGGCCST
jgi:hypothetical protein